MFLSPPSAMSSLLLDPNSATYRRTRNDSVPSNFGAEMVTEPLASTTMGSPHNIRTMGKHPHLHSIVDQDGLTIRSFPEPSISCPSTTIWQQFINEDQCSEQAPPQGGPSRQPPRWTGNQAIITDTPLSPSQALPELRNFWTPRSPCNDLSPFASPLSDTSYLSEASNSPYTPSFQEFGYLPPHSPNHDQWGSPNPVDIASFSLLGLDSDDVADYNGMHLLDTTQRSPIGDGEQKDLSPLAGLFYFDNSVETTHPNIQINQHYPSCSPVEASPEIGIKLEVSPSAPNSPLPAGQYGDLLSPSPPPPAPRPSNQRRKNARQSKRFSPHPSKSPKQPRDSSSTLQPKDKHSREELDRVFTFVKSLRDREEDVRLARGINSHELGGGGDQSAQTKSRTMEYLRDFWNRTYEEWTSFQQFFADEVVADYILSQSPENAVASAAILRASEARRSRPSKYWCPKWCGATFTSPDRAYSHLLSHEKMRPYHCSLCSETFGTPDVRNRHEVTKHKLVKPGKAVRRNP